MESQGRSRRTRARECTGTQVGLPHMEGGRRARRMQAISGNWKRWGNILPWSFQKEFRSADTVTLAQWSWFQTSDFQKGQKNSSCLRNENKWGLEVHCCQDEEGEMEESSFRCLHPKGHVVDCCSSNSSQSPPHNEGPKCTLFRVPTKPGVLDRWTTVMPTAHGELRTSLSLTLVLRKKVGKHGDGHTLCNSPEHSPLLGEYRSWRMSLGVIRFEFNSSLYHWTCWMTLISHFTILNFSFLNRKMSLTIPIW